MASAFDPSIAHSGWSGKGAFGLKGTVKGPLQGKSRPAVDLSFAVTDGKLEHEGIGVKLNRVSFSGALRSSGGKKVKPEIRIEDLIAEQDGETISMDLQLTNPSDPQISMRADGRVAIASLLPLLNDPGSESPLFSNPKGHVVLRNVEMSGAVSALRNGRQQSSGVIEFDHAHIEWNGTPYDIPDGSASISGDAITVGES